MHEARNRGLFFQKMLRFLRPCHRIALGLGAKVEVSIFPAVPLLAREMAKVLMEPDLIDAALCTKVSFSKTAIDLELL